MNSTLDPYELVNNQNIKEKNSILKQGLYCYRKPLTKIYIVLNISEANSLAV